MITITLARTAENAIMVEIFWIVPFFFVTTCEECERDFTVEARVEIVVSTNKCIR